MSKRITKMETDINSMDSIIRSNQRSCTNSMVERENEFVLMLDELKKEAKEEAKAGELLKNLIPP